MQRVIKVFQTKENNYTLSINGVFLHSKYYPAKEAEKFIENNIEKLNSKKFIIIYGIGLGYHIKKLMDMVGENCKVYAFDADEDVIKKSEELGILDKLKNDRRIEMFCGYSKDFFKQLSIKMGLADDIIIYKPSLRTLPLKYEDLINLLNSYELAKIAIEKHGKIAKKNYLNNIKENSKSIKQFFYETNFSNKPIVIAAGGPSLEDHLIDLKKFRNNIYIFALGRTIDILVKNGIIPDIITIMDPQDIVYEQIKDYLKLNIPLCFLSTANSKAIKGYRGPKYIFFNDLDASNKDKIIIKTGKSVAVAALDIAVKCGSKEVIFVGQDLAFLRGKFHAGDNCENNNALIQSGIKKVIGVDGRLLNTTSGMLEFKRNIEDIIKNNVGVTFINCSKGAIINGTLEKDFQALFS